MSEPRFSRRRFLELAGGAVAAMAAARFSPLIPAEAKTGPSTEPADPIPEIQQALSRKEKFQPFNRGVAEWQYVAFQYSNEQGQKIGVTVSMGQLISPTTGEKTQQLLVMEHNLSTGVTKSHTYDGARTFDPNNLTYSFKNNVGFELARFSYQELSDDYLIRVNTPEFDSDMLDPVGLTLKPQGDLMAVSKDGNFPVAAYQGGRLDTNYFADHVAVRKQDGTLVGFGRRDSENLEIVGQRPTNLDVDHTWVHTAVDLVNGKRAFITAWGCKTGGDFRFADVMIVDRTTGKVESFVSKNEEDSDFSLEFAHLVSQSESIPNQTPSSSQKMTHGGKVVAKSGNQTLFEITLDGRPGQFIDGKGLINMIEAHAVASGSVMGIDITTSLSALWETTTETYYIFLSNIIKN